MTGNMELAALLVLLVAELTLGDAIDSVLNHKDPCTSLCENAPVGFSVDSMYVKSCCQRGCRFFNLVDLRYGLEQDSLNGTRSACEASCIEAYANLNDRYVCNAGCSFMARQRISDLLLPPFTVAVCMEESVDLLPMSPDIPENDILTDPGLRKELLPRWWDADGFKLPETHVKTIPMDDARTMDYSLSSEYSGETKQPASTSKSDSLQGELKQAKNIVFRILCSFAFGQLYVFFFPMIIFAATLYFVMKMDILQRKRPCRNISSSVSSKDIVLFMPNEVVIYKVPPPKRLKRHRPSLHQLFDTSNKYYIHVN